MAEWREARLRLAQRWRGHAANQSAVPEISASAAEQQDSQWGCGRPVVFQCGISELWNIKNVLVCFFPSPPAMSF